MRTLAYYGFCFLVSITVGQSAFISNIHKRAKGRPIRMASVPLSNARLSDTAAMVVVFGRAGAGKTTVANAAIDLLTDESIYCLGLDLDDCVPQWMRDNFGKGIYPTLKERQDFATSACDHVHTKLQEQSQKDRDTVAIVSFSFVNTDMREIFRQRFPSAVWALLDTTESEADDRIQTREGHFYKGAPSSTSDKETIQKDESLDNSDWKFAPVTFSHTVLLGNDFIETNAKRVADIVRKELGR